MRARKQNIQYNIDMEDDGEEDEVKRRSEPAGQPQEYQPSPEEEQVYINEKKQEMKNGLFSLNPN